MLNQLQTITTSHHSAIDGAIVERVNNIKFMGMHFSDDLTTNTTAVVKKAQKRIKHSLET